jgi:hypothetical protein
MQNDNFLDQGFEAQDIGEKGEELERKKREAALGSGEKNEGKARELTEEEKAVEQENRAKKLLHQVFAELGINPQENLDLTADCYEEVIGHREVFEGKDEVVDLKKAFQLAAVGIWRNLMRVVGNEALMEKMGKVDSQVIAKNLEEGVWRKMVLGSEIELLNQENRRGIVTDRLPKVLGTVTPTSGEAWDRSSPEWQKLQGRMISLDQSEIEKVGYRLGLIMQTGEKLSQLASGEVVVDKMAQGDEREIKNLPYDVDVSTSLEQKQEGNNEGGGLEKVNPPEEVSLVGADEQVQEQDLKDDESGRENQLESGGDEGVIGESNQDKN